MDASKVDFTRMYDLARDILNWYKEQLEQQRIDASGKLSDTADFDFDFNGTQVTLYFILEEYWRFVEDGRKPTRGTEYGRWVNANKDIQDWIRHKIERGSFIPQRGHTIPKDDKEIKRVAGAIVYKIHKFGYYDYNSNGKHILESILDQAESNGIIDQMVDTIYKVYDQQIDIEVQKLW